MALSHRSISRPYVKYNWISFILIPIGMVLCTVYSLLIGLLLLQKPAEEVDFV